MPALHLCGGVTGPSFRRRGHLLCCCDNRSLYIVEMLSAAGFSPDANGHKWAPTATKLITSFSSARLPFLFFLLRTPPPAHSSSPGFLFLSSCLEVDGGASAVCLAFYKKVVVLSAVKHEAHFYFLLKSSEIKGMLMVSLRTER